MPFTLIQIPVLKDNYSYLLRDENHELTAAVDPSVAEPVTEAVEARGWKLTHILNTHHHWDHTGGNLALKSQYGCKIIGYQGDAHRIPGIDVELKEGETFQFGAHRTTVIFIPGHTLGHIAYWFEAPPERLRSSLDTHLRQDAQNETGSKLFCGDTLFMMGCGRLFEGTPQQMYGSLQKIDALPDDTLLYCGHEYTEANGTFALTLEPENKALQARMEKVRSLRAEGKPTVPATLAEEKATNPFLRLRSAEIRRNLRMPDADEVEVFAEIRHRKDRF
jgi:hydroxyacylglutathione hydrolase